MRHRNDSCNTRITCDIQININTINILDPLYRGTTRTKEQIKGPKDQRNKINNNSAHSPTARFAHTNRATQTCFPPTKPQPARIALLIISINKIQLAASQFVAPFLRSFRQDVNADKYRLARDISSNGR